MIAVKGYYKDRQIKFMEPLPKDVLEAELNIIVIPKEIPMNNTHDSERYFKMLGCYNFFDSEDDKYVDWEEHFGIKT